MKNAIENNEYKQTYKKMINYSMKNEAHILLQDLNQKS